MYMRITYIANVRLPTEKAHGLQIMKMCEAFARAGADVELVVPKRKNPLCGDPFMYYGVERSFRITTVFCLDVLWLPKIGFLIELVSFLCASSVYAWGRNGTIYTREELASLFFPGAFLELHTLPAKLGWIRRALFKRARALFVLTSFMKQSLTEWGIEENHVSVLPDGVDIASFDISVGKEEARARLSLPRDMNIVLYTGSFFLYPWKGVDVLLETARNYQLSIINYQKKETLFLFVGGSEKEIAEVRKKYKTENVLLLGHQPHSDIPYYLKAADVLVLPNKSGYAMSEKHTSPLKLFEYMASGRPIISADLPSLREILTEEEAVFFTPNNPDDLSRAILEVLSDSVRAERLARYARRKVEQYTWDKRARKILSSCL